MGKIDEMVALQNELQVHGAKTRSLSEQYQALTARESAESVVKRMSKLAQQIRAVQITVDEEEHGPFTAEHEPKYSQDRVAVKYVEGCLDCQRIDERYGVAEFRRERRRVAEQMVKIKEVYDQLRPAIARLQDLQNRLKTLGKTLGLPAYEGSGLVKVERGQNYRRVTYRVGKKEAQAVFVQGELLLAYHLGDGSWRVMRSAWEPPLGREAWAAIAELQGKYGTEDYKTWSDAIDAYNRENPNEEM